MDTITGRIINGRLITQPAIYYLLSQLLITQISTTLSTIKHLVYQLSTKLCTLSTINYEVMHIFYQQVESIR